MTLEQTTRYRNHYDITQEILTIVSEKPSLPTGVMYGVRLSYSQLVAYKNKLLADNLITIQGDHWMITQKGKERLAILKEALA